MTERLFTEDDGRWAESYVDRVARALRVRLEPHSPRFPESHRLLDRLSAALKAVVKHGWSKFSGIDEAHNEICVAIAILESREPPVARLLYEPPLVGTSKSVDFVAEYVGGATCFVDVKTIVPRSKDRWEQYATAQGEGWLPDNVSVTLLKEWLGGELWHNKVAARSRMLEYASELESKLAAMEFSNASDCVFLVLCSNGFHWHPDELEDFVAFYRTGVHRADDPFARMEERHIQAKAIKLTKTIQRFAYFERTSSALLPGRLNWNVVAPPAPF
jgi:hypothetical protein